MRKVLVLSPLIALSVTACGKAEHAVEVDLPENAQQADLNAISDACGSPREILFVEGGEVLFRPAPEMDYETSACVLKGIQDAGITNFGFVGNERFQTPEGQ